MLADEGLLEKRRGIGMFVAVGARQRLLEQRRKQFTERHIEPMITEASRLGIDADELTELIRKSSSIEEGVTL
jgi:DNA-binding transcriptional regulator YhcF (GntR family)